jgi:hypothetical protein
MYESLEMVKGLVELVFFGGMGLFILKQLNKIFHIV